MMRAVVVAFGLAVVLVRPAAAREEIVVTGERRPASAGAASIAVLGRDEIRRVDADHPSELLNRASGVLIHRGNGVEQLTAIRSPVLTGGSGAGSFLFLQDGVPLRSAGFGNVNALFEAQTELADRIEIVRGPSGPLYGSNAVHGVVNVLTPRPPRSPEAGLSASVDTYARVKGDAYAGGTLGRHGLWGGVSLLSEHGFREQSGVDIQKAALRHVFAGNGFSADTVFSFVNLNQETAGFVVGPSAYRDRVLRRGNLNPEAFRDARAYRIQSELQFRLSDGATLSVTPFARKTDTAFLLHFFPSKALETNGHSSVGVQTAFYYDPSPRFSLIAGVDAEATHGDLSEVQTLASFGSFPRGVHYDFAVRARAVSGFVQGQAEVAPRLRATAGVRVDRTRYKYDNRTADGVFGRFLRPADRNDAYATASPKASLLYDLGEASLYLAYARGARPPQVQDLYRLTVNQTTKPPRPEMIDSVEIGWRGAAAAWLDFDLAAYAMDKRHVFFRDADGFNVNDGRTRHVGVEAAATARLGHGFTLDANATWAAHTYRFNRPALGPGLSRESIRKGAEVDTAPRILAGARLLWAPKGGRFSGEAEWSRTGRYFADAANTLVYPGHDLLNLRAAWRVRGDLSVNVVLRNALDALYAERADVAFSEERYFPGEGRALTMGFSAKL